MPYDRAYFLEGIGCKAGSLKSMVRVLVVASKSQILIIVGTNSGASDRFSTVMLTATSPGCHVRGGGRRASRTPSICKSRSCADRAPHGLRTTSKKASVDRSRGTTTLTMFDDLPDAPNVHLRVGIAIAGRFVT